jgi:hypothetical protein
VLAFLTVTVGLFVIVAFHPITGAGTISKIELKQSRSEPPRLIHGFRAAPTKPHP